MMRAITLSLLVFIVPVAFSQEASLGDIARATRNQQSKSTHAAKVFSNEDNGPSEIKDGEDPVAVYTRARIGLLHDTAHQCHEESSGNSGPGWRKSSSYEVAASNRMRIVTQDGPAKAEWLMVADAYYVKQEGASWKKLASPEEIALGQKFFPAGLIPQEMQFAFERGDLKFLGNESVNGLPTVRYQYVVHTSDMDRTVNLWIGSRDSLPYRTEMRTETRSSMSGPVVWQESTSCKYGVDVKIEPPM